MQTKINARAKESVLDIEVQLTYECTMLCETVLCIIMSQHNPESRHRQEIRIQNYYQHATTTSKPKYRSLSIGSASSLLSDGSSVEHPNLSLLSCNERAHLGGRASGVAKAEI